MNVKTRNGNLIDKARLYRRGKRMQGQPQIFILVVVVLKFPKTYYQLHPREFPVVQRTDQKSQQRSRTSIGSCFLSRKNTDAEFDFQYTCRLQISNFRSGFLLAIFSRTPPVAFSTEFSKALYIHKKVLVGIT